MLMAIRLLYILYKPKVLFLKLKEGYNFSLGIPAIPNCDPQNSLHFSLVSMELGSMDELPLLYTLKKIADLYTFKCS